MRLPSAALVFVLIASCGQASPSLDDPAATPPPSLPTIASTTTMLEPSAPASTPPATAPLESTPPATARPESTPPAAVLERPAWLGTRPLPLRDDGFGEVLPTPPELVDRRIPTLDILPPPAGDEFVATIDPVPDDVAARSTWVPECPVSLEELAYVTVSFWGFDGLSHTGEMIVNASVASDVAEVFGELFASRFPIEEMRVVSIAELDAPPTGDGNNTTSFVCRPVTGGSGWSQHALGLAVDINPFHNPYQKGDLVVPELASAYTDRTTIRPGMIIAGDGVTEAMAAISWGWGGTWTSLTDTMHFSANGR